MIIGLREKGSQGEVVGSLRIRRLHIVVTHRDPGDLPCWFVKRWAV